jgi:hypothetical protein
MGEESRLRFQKYYHAICRERGWTTEDGEDVWPASAEERAHVAREIFGLALIFGTDSSFYHVKEQIDAQSLSATPTLNAALETIRAMDDDQKSAILTLVDDILDFAVYQFAIQLDRFEHGFLSLRFQNVDDKCDPQPETEVEINPYGIYEMFQDAVRWKTEFSMGTDIGRPEDPNELAKIKPH